MEARTSFRLLKLFLLGASSFLLEVAVSCVRETDLTPESEPNVVVECLLNTEPIQHLQLSLTDLPTERDVSDWSSAEAFLTDNTEGRLVGRFYMNKDGTGELPYAAIPGHSYTLRILSPWNDSISASTDMPQQCSVEWYLRHEVDGTADGTGLYGIQFFVRTLPEEALWIYAMDTAEGKSELHVADQLCTDYPEVDLFNIIPDIYADGTTLGSIYSLYATCLGRNMHRKLLRFPPTLHKDRHLKRYDSTFCVAGRFHEIEMFREKPSPGKGYLVFMSVSESYDQFLKGAVSSILKTESSSLSQLYTRENLPSNIEGGIGCFGATVKQIMPWNEKIRFGPWEY